MARRTRTCKTTNDIHDMTTNNKEMQGDKQQGHARQQAIRI